MSTSSASLQRQFDQQLQQILAGPFAAAASQGIAIAYSGGLDSSVLLALARRYCTERRIALFAFHVHHGLSVNADVWLAHCALQAEAAGAVFEARKVQLVSTGKDGIEASARIARYAALGELCRRRGPRLLLTAHHQDDQAETLLLQLLRGAGVAGLSGMDACNAAPTLLGDAQTLIARPLLDCSRQDLHVYADANQIAYVEDESNADPRYARNALRLRVMPILAELAPGFAARLARSAQHLGAAHRMLQELAQQDLASCLCEDGSLDMEKMRAYSSERIDSLLRHWLGTAGMRMPSSARLAEMRAQLFGAREDACVSIDHEQWGIHRYGGRIYAERNRPPAWAPTPVAFRWQGEEELRFPEFFGSLRFVPAAWGFDPAWLVGRDLRLRLRQGGEKLKLAANRPTRDIKHHYQSLGIPFWQRQRLPFVCADAELLFAAGVGMNQSQCVEQCEDVAPVALQWKADN